MRDWGVWLRSDGARLVVPVGRPRSRWPVLRFLLGLIFVAAVVSAEGCCPDEDRWFLTLHCTDGAHEVECYTQASCRTLADAVLRLGTACESGAIGVRRSCE